jgi:hypothetical protein
VGCATRVSGPGHSAVVEARRSGAERVWGSWPGHPARVDRAGTPQPSGGVAPGPREAGAGGGAAAVPVDRRRDGGAWGRRDAAAGPAAAGGWAGAEAAHRAWVGASPGPAPRPSDAAPLMGWAGALLAAGGLDHAVGWPGPAGPGSAPRTSGLRVCGACCPPPRRRPLRPMGGAVTATHTSSMRPPLACRWRRRCAVRRTPASAWVGSWPSRRGLGSPRARQGAPQAHGAGWMRLGAWPA